MDDSSKPKRKQTMEWVAIGIAFLAFLTSVISVIVAIRADENSKRFSIINAEVQWNDLVTSYNEVDDQIRQWEESKGLKRDGPAIENTNQLDQYIKALSIPISKCKPTTEIIRLYKMRSDRYESLKIVAKRYQPVKDRLRHIDFSLPNPPRRSRRSRGPGRMGMGMN